MFALHATHVNVVSSQLLPCAAQSPLLAHSTHAPDVEQTGLPAAPAQSADGLPAWQARHVWLALSQTGVAALVQPESSPQPTAPSTARRSPTEPSVASHSCLTMLQ